MNRLVASIAAALVGWTSGHALAQADPARSFPERPVRIVVPFGAAGGTTAVARVLAAKMGESLGQQVLVENKPGAQGIIAAEFVRRAAPDGYTMLIGTSGPMAVNSATHANLPYHPLRDFAPVAMIGSYPLILVVNGSLPVKSVQELIEYGKARPDGVNYGSTGAISQLACEYFNLRAGTRFVHIPYKSSGDFVNAVLANEVTFVFTDLPPLAGHVRTGRLRVLAVASAGRHRAFPDIPTMAEAGMLDFVIEPWNGFFVPAATPAPIVQRLYAETARAVASPEVRERLEGLGIDPNVLPGEAFAKVVAAEIARWTTVAKAANIKAE